MYEVRAHGELPIEGKLDGGYVRKRLEDMGLRGQFAEAIRPAEEVLHRRALGLMDQDGIPDGASQFGEGSGARDHQMVDDLTGVCQEPEPRHHIDRFVSDETRDVVPRGLRTQSCRHGENLDGRTRVVDQRVQDPPVKSRQLVFQWHSGDSLPYRRMTEELLEGRDRLLYIVGPDLYGHTAIDLPRNPSDVGSAQRSDRFVSTPLPAEGDEQVLAPEDSGVDRHPISVQDPPLFEAAKPLADRGSGEGHLPAESLVTLPRVFIERDEKPKVLGVHTPRMTRGL